MNQQNLVIEKIIKELNTSKKNKQEIKNIINDLENKKIDRLKSFIAKYYQNVFYSKKIKLLLNNLVNENLLSKKYLDYLKVNVKLKYTILNFSENKYIYIDNTPLKLTEKDFEKLFRKTKDYEEEFLSLDDTDIEKLRKKIIKTQAEYANNTDKFIFKLENKAEKDIYETLINLSDIRFIQHSLASLNIDTLQKLLAYINNLQAKENQSLINSFLKEVIKKILNNK